MRKYVVQGKVGGGWRRILNLSYGDIIGGFLITIFGVFILTYSERYGMGTLQRVGPGFFPRALGILLIGLGVIIAIPGLFRADKMPRFKLRPFVCILASLVFFALTLRTLGLVIATSGTVLISSLATDQLTWVARAGVMTVVTALTYVVFIIGLRMILPIWP